MEEEEGAEEEIVLPLTTNDRLLSFLDMDKCHDSDSMGVVLQSDISLMEMTTDSVVLVIIVYFVGV